MYFFWVIKLFLRNCVSWYYYWCDLVKLLSLRNCFMCWQGTFLLKLDFYDSRLFRNIHMQAWTPLYISNNISWIHFFNMHLLWPMIQMVHTVTLFFVSFFCSSVSAFRICHNVINTIASFLKPLWFFSSFYMKMYRAYCWSIVIKWVTSTEDWICDWMWFMFRSISLCKSCIIDWNRPLWLCY